MSGSILRIYPTSHGCHMQPWAGHTLASLIILSRLKTWWVQLSESSQHHMGVCNCNTVTLASHSKNGGFYGNHEVQGVQLWRSHQFSMGIRRHWADWPTFVPIVIRTNCEIKDEQMKGKGLTNIEWAYAVAGIVVLSLFGSDPISVCRAKDNDLSKVNYSQLNQRQLWQEELKSYIRLLLSLYKFA